MGSWFGLDLELVQVDAWAKAEQETLTLNAGSTAVKAMVFPVFMCGCESWTIKKPERQRTDGFELRSGEDY